MIDPQLQQDLRDVLAEHSERLFPNFDSVDLTVLAADLAELAEECHYEMSNELSAEAQQLEAMGEAMMHEIRTSSRWRDAF